jgi:predicted enzyme related to lactoylglutathione lyase
VMDLPAVVAAVAQNGGKILQQTRIEQDGITKAIFVTDPDGMRIELVQASGGVNAPQVA